MTIVEVPLWMLIAAGFALAVVTVGLVLPRFTDEGTVYDRLAKWLGIEKVHPAIVGFVGVLWAALFVTLTIGLYFLIWDILRHAVPDREKTTEIWDWRFKLVQITALTTVVGALVAFPLSVARTTFSSRQTEAQEQGLITERITRAVEGLGAEKTVSRIGRPVKTGTGRDARSVIVYEDETAPEGTLPEDAAGGKWQVFSETRPNMEVRIGAIYALERIAQDSLRDHVQIMEILCAYVRENSPADSAVPVPDHALPAGWEDAPEVLREWGKDLLERLATWRRGLKTRQDVQAALDVIGRRSAAQRAEEARAHDGDGTFVFDAPFPPDPAFEGDVARFAELGEEYQNARGEWREAAESYRGYRIDLRGCNLQGYDLAGKQLQGADLREVRMQGAFLGAARMQGADLWQARMQGADLQEARMQGAVLRQARMQGAVLWQARMQGADLLGAQMQGADLRVARMQGADLWEARMQGALHLSAATLRGAALRWSDHTDIPDLTGHVAEVFGDASVTLPGGITCDDPGWPDHWPRVELGYATIDGARTDLFDREWRKWLADPEGYDRASVEAEVQGTDQS